MRRFRRWLVRLVVIAAALSALLALGIGLVAEKYFPQAVAELDARLGRFTVAPERFERGWWSSRLTIAAEDASGTPAWRYRARLAHGPLIRGPAGLGWIGGQGTLELVGGKALAAIDWGLTPGLTLVAHADFGPPGGPAGEIDVRLGERFSRLEFELRGLASDGAPPAGFDDVDGSGWAALGGDRPGGRIELSGRRLFWPGAAIDAPALVATADRQGDLIELRVQASAAHAGLDQSYRDVQVALDLQRLHGPTLEQFGAAAARIAEAGLPARMRDRQLADHLLLVLPGLLQHRPRVALKELRLRAPQGAVTAAGSIALSEAPPGGYLAEPARLLPALEADWEARLPDALARHWLGLYLAHRGDPPEQTGPATDEFIARRRAEGWLVAEGTDWLSRGQLAGGRFSLNGAPPTGPEPPPAER